MSDNKLQTTTTATLSECRIGQTSVPSVEREELAKEAAKNAGKVMKQHYTALYEAAAIEAGYATLEEVRESHGKAIAQMVRQELRRTGFFPAKDAAPTFETDGQ